MKTDITLMLVCLILTSLSWAQDAVKDGNKDKPTAPAAKASPQKQIVDSLVGSWEGTCRTWFKPGQLVDESKVKGEIRPILDGRLIRHTYEGSMQGKPRHGEETIVYSSWAKLFQVSW